MTRRVAFDVDAVRLDDIADALQDQETYEHHWTFDPRTGDVGFASRDLDGEDEEPDAELVIVEPYPSSVWYRDMADFAEGLSDERASRRLLRALDGRGAFRHFKNENLRGVPGTGEHVDGIPERAGAAARGRVAARRGLDRRNHRPAPPRPAPGSGPSVNVLECVPWLSTGTPPA
jgi:hypothetical protein